MSKKGEIFVGLTSAVVTAALLGGAATFVYFYPLDYKQKTEKITEKPQTQEVVSKSEEKEIPTESSDTDDTSAPKSETTTNETGSMIIHPDKPDPKFTSKFVSQKQTQVICQKKSPAKQTPVEPKEPKKKKPLSELKTLRATIDKKSKVLHVDIPCPTEDFKIKRKFGVTPKDWRKTAQYIQFKGDKEPRNLLHSDGNTCALVVGDKVGDNDTPTLIVYWI
ncbi:MAG: hypothetical protein Q4D57_00240 [Clostridia bacterium]|nr:hypothetical protein [Clostridia bacterium]